MVPRNNRPTYEMLRAAHIAVRLSVKYDKALAVVQEWNGMNADEKAKWSNHINSSAMDEGRD